MIPLTLNPLLQVAQLLAWKVERKSEGGRDKNETPLMLHFNRSHKTNFHVKFHF